MKITVHSSKAVKPAYRCGNGGLSAGAAAAAVPLSVFDKVTFDTHFSVIYGFRPLAPSNAALEAGLARVLVDYREWAGRFGVDADGNRVSILLNDEGARFVEATADVTLDSVMPLKSTPELETLHPGRGEPELMLIQVTRFACGSLVVGFTTHHAVADGRATSNFFVAWSQATRGVAVDPAPMHDRASPFAPRDPLRVEFEHRGAEFEPRELHDVDGGDYSDVVVHKVHLSGEFISRLKSRALPAAAAGAQCRPRCSTVQCVVAHLWRCMTAARGLGEQKATTLHIAVDGRARMSPPVPEGYTGNVVLWARPTAVAGELVARPLQHAVELIGREVARIDDAYFKSFIDFASSGAVEKERLAPTAQGPEMILSPDIEVDSWLRIPFYDLDFGGGRPFFFMPSFVPVEGLLILLPSLFGDGGVDAYVALFSRDMDTFKNCCYSLD
ncbi:hypothetical protein ACP4OV_006523 [Aristida adscensionis]